MLDDADAQHCVRSKAISRNRGGRCMLAGSRKKSTERPAGRRAARAGGSRTDGTHAKTTRPTTGMSIAEELTPEETRHPSPGSRKSPRRPCSAQLRLVDGAATEQGVGSCRQGARGRVGFGERGGNRRVSGQWKIAGRRTDGQTDVASALNYRSNRQRARRRVYAVALYALVSSRQCTLSDGKGDRCFFSVSLYL